MLNQESASPTLLNLEGLLPAEMARKAEFYARKAISLEEDLAEAHYAMGLIHYMRDWDWANGEKEMRLAIQINPNFADAYDYLGQLMVLKGRPEEAVKYQQKAVELDPLMIRVNCNFGWGLYVARQYDRAIEQAERTLELPNAPLWDHIWIAMAYNMQGKNEQTLERLDLIKQRGEKWSPWIAERVYALAALDRKEEAEALIHEMLEIRKKRYVNSFFIAVAYAGLKDADRTFEWLEKGFTERNLRITSITADPKFDFLREDPRYEELLEKIGLADN